MKLTSLSIANLKKDTSYLFCRLSRDRLALRWSEWSGSPLKEDVKLAQHTDIQNIFEDSVLLSEVGELSNITCFDGFLM